MSDPLLDLSLKKPCPACNATDTLCVEKNTIRCSADTCSFQLYFGCPLCDSELSNAVFETDSYGDYFTCPQCTQSIYLRRIKYLVETGLLVDQSTRCTICNGPTIHRSTANMGHRCFFFPKCSGQTDLFNIAKETIVFLDFETTGLESTRDHIIEIGALKIDEEGFDHVFESLVKPPVEISKIITSITHITNDMVANASSIDHVFPKLIQFIGNARVVAHNAEFDVPWLLINAHRLHCDVQIKDIVCTMKWAKRAKEPSAALGKLTKKYQIAHHNAHRALSDAVSTKELYFIYDQRHPDCKCIEPLSGYHDISKKQLEYYERTKKFSVLST
jgi:DNA polymerase III epsilon subunit family exonuclease